jgi:ribosomal protein L11 methyltransferase
LDYTTLWVECSEENRELLISALFELGFDSFQEEEDGFLASIESNQYSKTSIETLQKRYPSFTYSINNQPRINWNEEWEKNYHPIVIDGKCLVRATFHKPDPVYPYEIIVTPKMSFGTGHHDTTYLMLSYQIKMEFERKRVLDVGAGTGILSIMAKKKGAAYILATDIDDWCIENSRENFELNHVQDYQLVQDNIEEVKDTNFHIVLANINKNVLLDQLPEYEKRLTNDGLLLVSGFYESDIPDLTSLAENIGLSIFFTESKNNWAMIVFKKHSRSN